RGAVVGGLTWQHPPLACARETGNRWRPTVEQRAVEAREKERRWSVSRRSASASVPCRRSRRSPSILSGVNSSRCLVSKRFGAVPAVETLTLDIVRGEFFALLGPSGCGKTTLLRLLAGFETPSEGRILLDGADIVDVPPHRRPVNMMFQSYALFPHLTVEGNIAFGLRQDKLGRDEIAARVGEMLELVRLQGFGARRVHQLSGGQRQRVALARSLIKRPRVLLLDEPL